MMRSPKRTLAASMLVLEAFAVFFGALVAGRMNSDLGIGRALTILGGLALACVVTAGLLRWRAGFLLGGVLQVLVIATGLWLPAMYFVGAVFALLWVLALRVGGRIERERALHAPAGEGDGGQ